MSKDPSPRRKGEPPCSRRVRIAAKFDALIVAESRRQPYRVRGDDVYTLRQLTGPATLCLTPEGVQPPPA